MIRAQLTGSPSLKYKCLVLRNYFKKSGLCSFLTVQYTAIGDRTYGGQNDPRVEKELVA